MYMNTTYKAFVAETAAKIAAELVNRMTTTEDEDTVVHKAVRMADKLAGELEDWWQSKNGHETIMFDVEDSLTSNIERELSGIADKLEELRVHVVDYLYDH